MDKEKLIILVQGHECLYNLQHNNYDNNLVKDNCWKEIAAEWQGSGKAVAGSRQGDGKGTAWERHGMCESAFIVLNRSVDPAYYRLQQIILHLRLAII
jgi:hypothetical protein